MPGRGEEREEDRTHPRDPLTLIAGLRKTVQLPSFKVRLLPNFKCKMPDLIELRVMTTENLLHAGEEEKAR